MKMIIGALTALSVLAGAAVPASAEAAGGQQAYQAHEVKTSYKKRKKYKKRYYRRSYGDDFGYYPRWADKLPIGTSAWWRQMDREGRGGRRQ